VRAALALLLVLAGLTVAGCGLGAGEGGGSGASLTVSRDFGARQLGRVRRDDVPGGETVMRLLQRSFDVDTRYGGHFVQGIAGLDGGRERGRPVDWFYYVNGIEAEEGAAARKLASGDRVWWDRHDWGAAMRVPAVVGSFPEPFLSGSEGKRLPVRIDCARDADEACDEVAERLRRAGVSKVSRAAFGGGAGRDVLRILVGTWRDIRGDNATARIEAGPGVSGVFAKPDSAGQTIELLDGAGARQRELGPGSGLIAATRFEDQQPTWVVTGTDAAGLASAAAALEEGVLSRNFALAIDGGRGVPVPVRELGAGQP
jgi:hypothetical protein